MWLSHTITIIWYQSLPQFMHSTGIMFLFDLCYMCINKNFTFYFCLSWKFYCIYKGDRNGRFDYIYMWVMLLICMTFYSSFFLQYNAKSVEIWNVFSALNRIKSWYILYFSCSIEIKFWYILYFSCSIEMRFIYSNSVLSWRT